MLIVSMLWMLSVQTEPWATYADGVIDASAVHGYVARAFPQGLQPPPETDWPTWLATLLAKTAADELLRAHPHTDACLQAPARRASMLWHVAQQLAAEVEEGFRVLAEPDPTAVARHRERLTHTIGQGLVLFRTIYLKTSGAGALDEAARSVRIAEIEAELKQHTFAAVAQKFSQGTTADRGGLVRWVPLDRLDPKVAGQLASLAVGAMAGPIHTRTGIHFLKLENRELLNSEQLSARARAVVINEIVSQQVDELLARIASQYPLQAAPGEWRLGSLRISKQERAELLVLTEQAQPDRAHAMLTRVMGLAWSTLRLSDPDDDLWKKALSETRNTCKGETLRQLVSNERRELSQAALKSFYDRHRDRFTTKPARRISLFFFDQGADAYATQTRLQAELNTQKQSGFMPKAGDPMLSQSIRKQFLSDAELGQLHPNILKALATMKPGTTSAPLYCPNQGNLLGPKSQLAKGFAIVTYHDRRPARVLTFAEAEAAVVEAYIDHHRVTLADAALKKLLDQHQFKVHELPSRARIEELLR